METILLNFTRSFLEDQRIHTYILKDNFEWDNQYDLGLRDTLMKKSDHPACTFPELPSDYKQTNNIYLIQDLFKCNYLLIPLFNIGNNFALLAGPFSFNAPTAANIEQLRHQLDIPELYKTFLHQYFSTLPIIHDRNLLGSYIRCLGNVLFSSDYDIKEIIFRGKYILEYNEHFVEGKYTNTSKILEERYRYEATIMEAVSNGDYDTIDKLTKIYGLPELEQRLSDTLRDKKNHLIILNTLLRIAAQRGQVHPVYLDELSSKIAYRIEALTSLASCDELANDMFRKYCFVVRSHSTRGYAPIIQSVINHISLHLSSDLSLEHIASFFSLNRSYLSNLFRKETGLTLTAFVTEKRMEHAVYLLNTTNTPIQDIACACGISDLNYFSKLFRKNKGLSPSEYRKMINGAKTPLD